MQPQSPITLAATLWLLGWLASTDAVAADLPPRLDLYAEIVADGRGEPTSVGGTMTFTGLPMGDLCFYLPFNDPDYGNNRGTQRRVDRLTGAQSHSRFSGGQLSLSSTSAGSIIPINDYLIRFVRPPTSDQVSFSFNAQTPLPADHTTKDWIFDGFYPQLLAACPSEMIHTDYLQFGVSTETHFNISHPKEYLYLGPGQATTTTARGSVLAQRFVFALAQGMKSMHFEVGDVPVEIHFRGDWFLELNESIQKLVPVYSALLGNPPFGKFVFVETGELQRTTLPGLIAINRPRQSAFNALLVKGTHWYHWQVARGLAHQWFGTAVGGESPDDVWLLEGIAEFAALEALRRMPERFDLFKPRANGRYFLSLDFMQSLEISAASLRRAAPFTRLANSQMQSARSHRLQHPFAYVRHTIALNQIAGQVGQGTFFAFLRSLVGSFRGQPLTPKAFIAHFGHLPSQLSPSERQQSAASLQNWWLSDGWPDFALVRFDKTQIERGKWQSVIAVEQRGAIDFPPVIMITDKNGMQLKVRARRAEGRWIATIETAGEPALVDVDPDHEAYDIDRFNNSDRWPSLRFFPGSANTLADDGYTVVWAPYAYRNPGEPFSVAVQGAMFRYIYGGLFLNGAMSPSTKDGLYNLRHRYEFPDSAIHGDFQISQDYEADRIIEATIIRSPLFDIDPEISVSARVRVKQRMGAPETAHETLVAGISMKPADALDVCALRLNLEWESSPPNWHPDFFYERRLGVAIGECKLGAFNLVSRAFIGDLISDGLVPESAMFKPNDLSEARLRLDVRELERVQKLKVSSNDFLFPLIIPLPHDSFVLSRRIKGKVFYDFGEATLPTKEYRAAGAGFSLPFGGDVSGAGSFSFTRLTVLAVLYTKVGPEVSRQPRFVFDFSGQL